MDLLAIGQGSPISDIIHRVLGTSLMITQFYAKSNKMFFVSIDTQTPFAHQLNNNMTPSSKKRPLEEKELEYVFAKPVSVAPTPRKTKRQSPGKFLLLL